MLVDDLFAILDPPLKSLGHAIDEGEEFSRPPLDVLRYYQRPVRLGWLPILGRARSLVAVVRQPVDLDLSGSRTLLERLARAAGGRYPPSRGPTLTLTTLVLTPEPIAPDDDAALGRALSLPTRFRAVPLGLFRINLGQEALSMALARGPGNLFPEPETIADALTPHLRRYVPPLSLD